MTVETAHRWLDAFIRENELVEGDSIRIGREFSAEARLTGEQLWKDTGVLVIVDFNTPVDMELVLEGLS